jgi:ribosomal protein S27E
MSEFKFSCPACGQNILCDTSHVGTQIACPVCNATIVVPKETAGPADVSTRTGIPPALPGNIATTAQRTSRLAIASLVCSLSSLITCVGWLPGIICGHLAKSRIRRNPSLKGSGLATAGLVIGYLILMLQVGAAAYYIWSFTAAVKHGFENVRQDLATNNVIITQTQPTTVSNSNQQIEPVQTGVVVTNNQQMEPAKPETVTAANPQIEPEKSEWTSDISKASFPDHPASGKLHGMDFTVKTASFRNGDLKIRAENGMLLDIFRLGESIEDHSYEIQPDDSGNTNPHVKMTWNEGGVIQTATFSKGYGMKLQFDQAINRTVSAKIYLCFPDDSKSCVAGTFEVRLPKQKPKEK